MATIKPYNNYLAVDYALKYALIRNPNFHNFDDLGGDCTNFCSQCLLAGSNNIMNRQFNPYWYYNNINDRSPSWTGVEFLYQYLINNKNKGPFANETTFEKIAAGDLIQLKFVGNNTFSHCLVVSQINSYINNFSDILVCAHTIDSLNRPLSNYRFQNIRFLKILGVYE